MFEFGFRCEHCFKVERRFLPAAVPLLALSLILVLASQPVQAVVRKHSKWHKSATKAANTTPAPSSSASPTAADDGSPQLKTPTAPTVKTEARKVQEFLIKAQQAQMRFAEENQRLLQEQLKQTQSVARANLAKSREEEEKARLEREANRKAHQRELEDMKLASAQEKSVDSTAATPSDDGEQEFKDQNKDVLHRSFSGPRKTTDRSQLPSLDIKPGQSKNAAATPFIIKTATGEQRRQAQVFQSNLQTQLSSVPGTMMPKDFFENKAFQLNTYQSDYPAFVNHQVIAINKKNTYIREVPPTQYPAWYERRPDWTYCNGFVLGSAIQVKSDWFAWDWPAQFGTAPDGFLCRPDYLPTPYFYVSYSDQWRQAGENAYKKGPDADYSGPISVETVEPLSGTFPDKSGVPTPQTINVIYMYNAYYQPEVGRWGYVNRQGNFVWLNI
jgi:hypothetical protein